MVARKGQVMIKRQEILVAFLEVQALSKRVFNDAFQYLFFATFEIIRLIFFFKFCRKFPE